MSERGRGEIPPIPAITVEEAERSIFIPKIEEPRMMLIQLLDRGFTFRVMAELTGYSESALRHIVNPSWRRCKLAGRNYKMAFRLMQTLTQLYGAYVRRD